MIMLLETTKATLKLLRQALEQMDDTYYAMAVRSLSGASIGQHVRHVAEMYQCLFEGMERGVVCYENRRRDRVIENSRATALSLLHEIEHALEKPDCALVLESGFGQQDEPTCRIPTSYVRELAYNLEHTIHHMALIRIGIEATSGLELSPAFGVAPSTLRHRGLHQYSADSAGRQP